MNSNFTKIIRIILGLGLILFGVSKLFPLSFMPTPEFAESASEFMNSLDNTGYILIMVGVLEIFIGCLLIAKKWVPFALILLAPLTINILFFHLFLDPSGLVLAAVVLFLNALLISTHWRRYKLLFH